MISPLMIICLFTFIIHLTETLAYSMRLAGLLTRQIAIAMSFVTATLLVSRLSNMFQAPLLGAMVDTTVFKQGMASVGNLEMHFRIIIFAGFLGTLAGALLTPTAVILFQKAICHFLECGSLPKVFFRALHPHNLRGIYHSFRMPRWSGLHYHSWKHIPKTFLVLNVLVASIYTIGVLCSLLAAAYLPDMRSIANQLSGIVNGLATILFTIFVDPAGARITDQAYHGKRSEEDVRSVVFFLQTGRLLGTLFVAQLLFQPFTQYIVWTTKLVAKCFFVTGG